VVTRRKSRRIAPTAAQGTGTSIVGRRCVWNRGCHRRGFRWGETDLEVGVSGCTELSACKQSQLELETLSHPPEKLHTKPLHSHSHLDS